MATNRKRTPRSRRESALTPDQLNLLHDRPLSARVWLRFMTKDEKKALWDAHKREVLEEWARTSPCTRPSLWWLYDAPKELVPGCDGTEFFALQAFRRRIGGIGTPRYECLNVVPRFFLGIPSPWIGAMETKAYSDRFAGQPIDPADPPIFESQADYLQRHGCLTKEEVKHLGQHPNLLVPETVRLGNE